MTAEAQAPPADRSTIPPSLNFMAPLVDDTLCRVGGRHDGGYVIPRSLVDTTDLLVSMGVSENWSFDEHFRRLHPGLRIHAYDHTISRMAFVRRVGIGVAKMLLGIVPGREVSRRVRLLKAYEAFFADDVTHFRERIHDHHDRRHDATLDQVFARTQSRRVFLKIDIEGGEYRVIDDILRHADRVTGMVIEFHDTHRLRTVFADAIRKLQARFSIVHLHANNYGGVAPDGLPDVLEVTFVPTQRCPGAARRPDLAGTRGGRAERPASLGLRAGFRPALSVGVRPIHTEPQSAQRLQAGGAARHTNANLCFIGSPCNAP
jgi:hypothetical protein